MPIQKCGDLQNLCIEELRKPVKPTDSEAFDALIESYRDMDGNVTLWKTVYESMKKQVEGSR